MQAMSNPALARMLRSYHGRDAVRHCKNRLESTVTTSRQMVRGDKNAPTSVNWYPGAEASKRAQTAQVAPGPQGEPGGLSVPPDLAAYAGRVLVRARGLVGATPLLPVRLAQCLDGCHSVRGAPSCSFAVAQMAAPQLSH